MENLLIKEFKTNLQLQKAIYEVFTLNKRIQNKSQQK